jgi:hypothetical protein
VKIMTSQQLNLDLTGLEIEVLELIPVDVSVGEHGVTEIGASCVDNGSLCAACGSTMV